jgi:hypothetical protein
MARPTFHPPLEPEHHGAAIVHLQSCMDDTDTRLAALETSMATVKRWSERAAWAAVMGVLCGANLSKEQLADLAVKLFAVGFGG